jgi:hypothetical protein
MTRPWTTAILRWLLTLAFWLAAEPARSVGLTPLARDLRHYGAWSAVEFRDPRTGLFLAARADTEDRRTHTTLTCTAGLADRCEPEAVVVIRRNLPALRSSEEAAYASARLDEQAPQAFRVVLVKAESDFFVFVQMLGSFRPELLEAHGRLSLALPSGRSSSFSLVGFGDAWRDARGRCRSFLRR